jgi:hypothetical protein
MPDTPLPSAHRAILLGEAADRFLDRYRDEPATAITYGETLAHLLAVAGDALPARR